MSDTRWGDVLLFVLFQAIPLFVWLRMRRTRPAATAEPPASVIPMANYVPPAEPDELRRVLSHG